MHSFFSALGNLLERDVDFDFDIGASSRAAAAVAKDAIEKRIAKAEAEAAEDLIEVNAAEKILGRNARGGRPSSVVGCALFRIGENRVGFGYLFETLFRAGLFVAVGMVLERERAEGVADRFGVGVAGHAKHIVIVAPRLWNGQPLR